MVYTYFTYELIFIACLFTLSFGCETTEWKSWRQCFGNCKMAVRTRNRDVIRPPFPKEDPFGGVMVIEECPPLFQIQRCIPNDCPSISGENTVVENETSNRIENALIDKINSEPAKSTENFSLPPIKHFPPPPEKTTPVPILDPKIDNALPTIVNEIEFVTQAPKSDVTAFLVVLGHRPRIHDVSKPQFFPAILENQPTDKDQLTFNSNSMDLLEKFFARHKQQLELEMSQKIAEQKSELLERIHSVASEKNCKNNSLVSGKSEERLPVITNTNVVNAGTQLCGNDKEQCCRKSHRLDCPSNRPIQMVTRWYRLKDRNSCESYNYAYCGSENESRNSTLRFEADCFDQCFTDDEQKRLTNAKSGQQQNKF